MFDTLVNGLGGSDLVIASARIAIGTFFVLSGYHKLFNPTRHASVAATLKGDGAPDPAVTQWVIPAAEFLGGIALVLGFLTVFASAGLLIICLGATCLDGLKRIPGYQPLDKADYLDDVLYLPEVLYSIFLIVFVAVGSGPLSADAIVASFL